MTQRFTRFLVCFLGASSSVDNHTGSHGDLAGKHAEEQGEKQLAVVPVINMQSNVVENGKGGMEDDSCHENGSLNTESVQVTVVMPSQREEEKHIG